MSRDLQEERKNIENDKHLDKHRASLVTQMIEFACSAGDPSSSAESGRSAGEVFLPAESHGQRKLVVPWGHK